MTSRVLSIAFCLMLASLAAAADCPVCGLPKCTVDHGQRAGQPTWVHRFAQPSNTSHYAGGIVGGGAVFKGSDPRLHVGTWGWDYSGVIPLKRIWLGWSHKHDQAGGGSYHTDGPRLRK